MKRLGLTISGIVQGVGFRPYLYRLAALMSLRGFVRNTSGGVYVEIEGEDDACDAFMKAVRRDPPPLSRITGLKAAVLPLAGDAQFVILPSEAGIRTALISPDIGVCDACRSELFDPNDRRFRYAFTNCTNCGPRFTIITDIPYDRGSTTMAGFIQCASCQAQYDQPLDRRFHAQPNACPVCGPELSFLINGKKASGDPIDLFEAFIAKGRTVAIKGLGGFHLACDANDERAVKRLRRGKARDEKPFAVMMRESAVVRRYCALSAEEEALLTCPRKPIVLLEKLHGASLAPSVAPGNARLGVMLPYTPLHCLIMEKQEALVLTSCNASERPMVFRDAEVPSTVAALADAVLTHNRAIVRRMDDSVMIVSSGMPRILRRARGFVPEPLPIADGGRIIFAAGAQQKNTFCLTKHGSAFLSGHIGDLDDVETERSYREEAAAFIRLFDAKPELAACDLHPDYLSSRYAKSLGLPLIPVQHHRAHFASVLAEHTLQGDAIGFIFDGTGLGDDGTVWGGEVFFGDIGASERVGHLLPFCLPGGDAAAHEPWRTALALTDASLGREAALSLAPNAKDAEILLCAAAAGINAPLSSSMGRLFDGIAALAGIRRATSFEGQAAVELEQAADMGVSGSYRFEILQQGGALLFDWRGLIDEVVRDVRAGLGAGVVSARFHRACVTLVRDAARIMRNRTGCRSVALSGGCFMNEFLYGESRTALEADGFAVYSNEALPVNDGGVSYGQAAIAARIYGG